MKKLTWYLRRVRSMEPQEIAYRVQQLIQTRLESAGFGLALAPTSLHTTCGHGWIEEPGPCLNPSLYCAAAENVLAGYFDVFAMKDVALGFPPSWNRDPKTGTVAPLTFGKSINYRDEALVGDIKYLWEPSRHTELVMLAQAYRLTGKQRYAEGCQTLIESWLDQCPYPNGPHWVSSLELGVRLVNWSVAWQLLRGEKSPLFADDRGRDFRQRWLASIYCHCHFINGYLSLHSSANNHLLGEYMGLFVAAVQWPLWPESRHWQAKAQRGFESEALRQTAADGVNREQAIWYHHEVADMMLICGLVARANSIDFAAAYWQRLETMLAFIAAMMNCAGRLPMIGDADDAVMVRFSREPEWSAYCSLLATGAVLFERPDFKSAAQVFDDKSRWMLGAKGETCFAALDAASASAITRAFPEGGYYILGTRFGENDEIKAVVDCGPLGYLSIAAHGHADALAMTLSVAGCDVLVDPGTFAYHTQEVWRNYFRSTFAHNTVCVDGVDQSVIGGNFLWRDKADAVAEIVELEGTKQRFAGHHTGYMRLDDPLMHRREIEFDTTRNEFVITDTLTCKRQHRVSLNWHFAETCTVTVDNEGALARCGPISINVVMPDARLIPTIHSGQEQPPAGWISRAFDVKVATATVVWSGEISGTTALKTHIAIEILKS